MNTILVTSTHEGTGKTAVTLALGVIARERSQSVGYMKPKGTRLQSRVGKVRDDDPFLARSLLDLDEDPDDLVSVVYSSPFVERAIRGEVDVGDLRTRIGASHQSLSHGRDLLLVEGGGRHLMGGVVDLTDPDVARLVDADVVLVATYDHPGEVDELLAAANDIGDRLVGVLFNRVSPDRLGDVAATVTPFLERRGVPVLGVLPRRHELAGVTVDTLAGELGATTVTEASTAGFVERFLVGAMGPEEALRSFRRVTNAAVITGGDRAEIHTAALQAPGVTCLVLTGGHRPSGTVVGKAEAAGIPILVVAEDTLTTIDRAEAVVTGGRARDERTVQVMVELLRKHSSVSELLDTEPPDERDG